MPSPWGATANNTPPNETGDRTPAPAGSQSAVLVGLIDLGHHDEEYDKKAYVARKVLFVWELTAEHKPDGSRWFVVKDYSFSPKMGKRAGLRKMLEEWRGTPYGDNEEIDLMVLLGKPCLVNITHGTSAKGNTYAKPGGISRPPKGMTVPRPMTEPFNWYYGIGYDFDVPEWLPFLYGRSVKDVMAESYEARGLPVPGSEAEAVPVTPGGEVEDDGPPF